MPIATLHIDNLGGWAGYTRTYKLDPPRYFDGRLVEYVSICIIPRAAHSDGEVIVVAATEQGVPLDGVVRRRAGSFVLEGNPDNPAYIEGCFVWALASIGGYEIQADES